MEKRSIKEWIVRTCILLAGLTIAHLGVTLFLLSDLVAVVLSDKLKKRSAGYWPASVFLPESDGAGCRIHGFHDGQRVKVDAHLPEALPAFLEAFLDDDTGADQLRTGLADQFA